jgi:hypothetical protein
MSNPVQHHRNHQRNQLKEKNLMSATKVLIMGAAGRDFHNFNTYFRDNPAYHVVAFTATQIPGIEGRTYPAELAGSLYPGGIPIYDERELDDLIARYGVEQVVFAYSDISHEYVMHKASQVMAAGAVDRRGAHWQRQEPDFARGRVDAQGYGQARGRRAPSDALWQPDGAARPAFCRL